MKKDYKFQEGEVLLVNKPLHWTSFQLVNKLRWLVKTKLKVKKIKESPSVSGAVRKMKVPD